ncbi:MAG: DUF6263 family protein [Gemmataceae bacterium]|nr:DUF6263 family protein [Gemmataceae bacterium]
MQCRRWLVAVVGALSVALLSNAAAQAQDEFKPEWKAFDKGKEWYQKLTTKTEQTMKVMGQEVKQKQEQTFYLKFTGQEPTKDGKLVVKQKIVGIVMNIDIGGVNITYNSTDANVPANPMTDFFKKLQEAELTLTVDPKTMEVVDVAGHEDMVKKLGDTNPQMAPLLNKILSKDAIKQMSEPTWGALPPGPKKKGEEWTKKSQLDLGPIGKYDTSYKYTYEGQDKAGDKVKVEASLTYTAPTDNKGLPFVIKSANLKSKEGIGAAYFDKSNGRFAKSEMRMKLEGTLEIDVGGMVTAVELMQDQTAIVESSNDNPVPPGGKK